MSDTVIGALIGLGGTVIGVLIAGPLTYYFSKLLIKETHKNDIILMQKQEAIRAASKFRATIIYELSGFYPLGQYWEKKSFDRLYNSIPLINSAAAEFSFFVKSENSFDKAVEDYNEYCRCAKADDVFTIPVPSMGHDSLKENKEKFKSVVDHLISFADEILNETKT